MNYNYRGKPLSYTINVSTLKDIMIRLHLEYLHKVQLDMIDEAVEKSDMSEANEVIKFIMQK
jgi:hypothetical protein